MLWAPWPSASAWCRQWRTPPWTWRVAGSGDLSGFSSLGGGHVHKLARTLLGQGDLSTQSCLLSPVTSPSSSPSGAQVITDKVPSSFSISCPSFVNDSFITLCILRVLAPDSFRDQLEIQNQVPMIPNQKYFSWNYTAPKNPLRTILSSWCDMVCFEGGGIKKINSCFLWQNTVFINIKWHFLGNHIVPLNCSEEKWYVNPRY